VQAHRSELAPIFCGRDQDSVVGPSADVAYATLPGITHGTPDKVMMQGLLWTNVNALPRHSEIVAGYQPFDMSQKIVNGSTPALLQQPRDHFPLRGIEL
jgi:hypothetical protein